GGPAWRGPHGLRRGVPRRERRPPARPRARRTRLQDRQRRKALPIPLDARPGRPGPGSTLLELRGDVMRRLVLTLGWLAALPVARAAPPQAPEPAIATVVAKVSADRLEADDARLVAFGTRNTFSEQMRGTRGVFAARAWIRDRFEEIAKGSRGRMT